MSHPRATLKAARGREFLQLAATAAAGAGAVPVLPRVSPAAATTPRGHHPGADECH